MWVWTSELAADAVCNAATRWQRRTPRLVSPGFPGQTFWLFVMRPWWPCDLQEPSHQDPGTLHLHLLHHPQHQRLGVPAHITLLADEECVSFLLLQQPQKPGLWASLPADVTVGQPVSSPYLLHYCVWGCVAMATCTQFPQQCRIHLEGCRGGVRARSSRLTPVWSDLDQTWNRWRSARSFEPVAWSRFYSLAHVNL